MLSPLAPYSLLKMHWSPEHAAPLAQWPEQHLDVSSTTSPPSALKHEPFSAARRGLHAPPGYPWASDDISALTASSLLKRYAEKYVSGVDLAYERAAPTPAGFAEPTGFLKTEPEPWPPLDCYGSLEKVPATGSVTVVSNLTSDSYSAGAALGAAAASCTAPSAQEYTAAYNSATYLPPGYCPQPPAPGLHSLQPYPASAPVYNYPPGCYPQSGLSSSYSHPSASYLPAGISVSSPLAPRPQGYSYGLSGPDTLKRKAFEMSESQEEGGADGDSARYRKFGNGHSKGNGFDAAKTVMTPPYGGGGDYSPPSGLAGDSASGEHSFPSQRMPMKIPATHATPQDTSGGR